MKNRACLEEFDLRVRRIKVHSEETSLTVFDAVVLNWRPIRKDWQESNQKIICVGNFYGIVENDHLHVKAEEFEDPVYGLQYQIYVSERVSPGTEVEMKKFLTSVKGVGAKNAERMIAEFGLDAISSVLKDPSCLNRLGLSKPAKDNLYQVIVENQAYEQLLLFLQLHGVAPRYATQVYKKYGDGAIDKIRDNPYSLYLDDVIDFPAADRLSQALGGNTNHGYRLSAGMLACLRNDSEGQGNVFVPRAELSSLLTQYLNKSLKGQAADFEPSQEDVEQALRTLVDDNYAVVDSSVGESPAVYLNRNYHAEYKVSERLFALSVSPKRFYASKSDVRKALEDVQAETKFSLAVEQFYAVETALCSPISILTGGPGTGKTQTLTMLIKTIKKLDPSADIRICAPTGKAAVRAQELTNMEASTIHRMIGYPKDMLQEDELVCDFVIADEFSMSDIQLCSWLFNCIWSGARLCIVGDHEQLPSVGPGLVLRDMIDSGCIPVTKLQTVFRQASDSKIIRNAHAIIGNSKDDTLELSYSCSKGGDFYFVESNTQSKISEMIAKSTQRLLDEGFPIEQIEVLSPIHGGLIGADNLNAKLQDLLNPGAPGYQLEEETELRVGDKVIQTRNNYDLSVFNGETGVVKSINYSPSRAVLISYPNRDLWYDSEQAEDLELAYAITTHRSQGSEFQAVIIPIHETLLYGINRNLLYTAITRAKKRVIFVGTKTALEIGLKKEGAMQRNSNLIVRLQSHFFGIAA